MCISQRQVGEMEATTRAVRGLGHSESDNATPYAGGRSAIIYWQNMYQALKGKSVFEMKFMKDAMQRGKAQADRMADDFMKELIGDVPGADSDQDGEHPPNADTAVERIGGRVSFRPGNVVRHLNIKLATVLIFL